MIVAGKQAHRFIIHESSILKLGGLSVTGELCTKNGKID
jgi:hypothetical protein